MSFSKFIFLSSFFFVVVSSIITLIIFFVFATMLVINSSSQIYLSVLICVAPHQPRLDWQMWFASLGTYDHKPWFLSLLHKLIKGNSQVLGLLADGHFEHQPPQFIKVDLFRYHFTENTTSFWKALWQRKYVYWSVEEIITTWKYRRPPILIHIHR